MADYAATRAEVPAHLSHLPRVAGLTLHPYPHATLTLEDGSTRDMGASTRASIMPPGNRSEGFAVLVMAWDNPEGEVFAVPPEVLPDVLAAFPVQGTACHLEATPATLLVTTTAGDLYQFTAPLNFTVARSLEPKRPDRLTLTDGAGWPVGIFDLPAGTPGASILQH